MKISDEIMQSFLRTCGSLREDKSALKAIKFFVDQNVLAVFGNDAYGVDATFDIEKEKIGERVNLIISGLDKKYMVNFSPVTISLRSFDDKESYTICMTENKKATNMKVISDEDAIKVEAQVIGMEENKETYDLIKRTSYPTSMDFEKVGYRLKPVGVKNNENEFFELTSVYEELPKSFFERIVSLTKKEHIKSIRTSYEMTDLLDYLPEIYSILEEKCEEEVSVRKKVLKK